MNRVCIVCVVLAGFLLVPGPAVSQANECEPSGTQVLAENNGAHEGQWFVHAIEKPAGAQLSVQIELFEFQRNGPGLVTSMLVAGDGAVVAEQTVRTDDHRAMVSAQSSTVGANESVIGPAVANPVRPSVLLTDHAPEEIGFDELYWVLGFDTDTGDDVVWEAKITTAEDNCGVPDPSLSSTSGDSIELYTTEDLDAERKISGGAHVPGWIQGAGTFAEGLRVTHIEAGHLGFYAPEGPLVAWAWNWDEGAGIQVDGPGSATLADEGRCEQRANYQSCAGWGSGLDAGDYGVTVEGTAAPDPTAPHRHDPPGPYILFAHARTP